jgi:hypothetical protein
VIETLDLLREYWPLTLRQVYYRLVVPGVIENSRSEYQKLSRILTRARLDGLVSWEALEDRARSTLESGGWQSASSFVAHERQVLLSGYRRDLLQGQPLALEIWIEKDALARIVQRAAEPYGIPVVVARGFSSVDARAGAASRA